MIKIFQAKILNIIILETDEKITSYLLMMVNLFTFVK